MIDIMDNLVYGLRESFAVRYLRINNCISHIECLALSGFGRKKQIHSMVKQIYYSPENERMSPEVWDHPKRIEMSSILPTLIFKVTCYFCWWVLFNLCWFVSLLLFV